MAYDWTPCDGCYNHNLTVYNTENGHSFKPVCKSYKCDKHGWMQTKKLQTALENHFATFTYIRMWTVTMTNRVSNSPEAHYKSLCGAWQRFITELRRNKLFTKSERATQYVRVCERHKSGYWHFHLLCDRFVDKTKVNIFWEHCVREELQISGHSGTIDIRGRKNAKQAAYYVSKYVTKSAFEAQKRQKLWTKSSKISIYPITESDTTFITWDSKRHIWLGLGGLRTSTCSIYRSTYPVNQLIDLFPDYVHRE